MDATQLIVNCLILGLTGAMGFIIKVHWEGIQDLQKVDLELRKADAELAFGMSELRIVVAGKCVTRDELDKVVNALFTKLDRMENKLDGKAERIR